MNMTNKKVLIADDEPHIRILMEQTLESLEDEGVELFVVGDGEEALETIKTEMPQLVFLDVMMPKMSGFEVCQAVKQELDIQGVYIIMLTAKGQEFDRHKGMQLGADLYMTKPFDPDEILRKAMFVLDL